MVRRQASSTPDAATEVIESLGADTFASGALDMASVEDGLASVPVDGWTQMIVYRSDLFEAEGLEPPTSYGDAVRAAIEALHNPPEMFGFVAATKIDDNFMSQVLEHVFLANGVSPLWDRTGSSRWKMEATVEVLEFYRDIAEASRAGEPLLAAIARGLYFRGPARRLIIWSPFILDELGGPARRRPPTINDDPTSSELAGLTGDRGPTSPVRRTPMARPGPTSAISAITADADTEAAQSFVEYSMSDGYTATLAIAPEGQVPGAPAATRTPRGLHRGLGAARHRCGPADVDGRSLRRGDDRRDRRRPRRGAALGRGRRALALASNIINSQIVNRLVREFIDGVRSAEEDGGPAERGNWRRSS